LNERLIDVQDTNTAEPADGNISQGDIDESVVTAVVGAYYPRLVSSVDSARSRAQSAYAIANTLAGGLVGISLVTLFATAPTPTLVVGAAAVGVWLLSAGLYVRAIASPLMAPSSTDAQDASQFVRQVFTDIRAERCEVDNRQKQANISAIVAVSLTALSFGMLLFGGSKTFDGND
jgi:hypothetical protein